MATVGSIGKKFVASVALAAAMLLGLVGVDSTTPAQAAEDCFVTIYDDCSNVECPRDENGQYNWKFCNGRSPFENRQLP